jgi:hypothetical protein
MIREPASFRDHTATVFVDGDRVLRGLRRPALESWHALRKSAFFSDAQGSGAIVATAECDAPATIDVSDEFAAWLQHARVPFVSYPYEWTFGMLRDAALLHLDLVEAALKDGLITKDGSS